MDRVVENLDWSVSRGGLPTRPIGQNPPFSQTNADPSGVDSGRWATSPIRALTRYTLAKIGLLGRAVKRGGGGQNTSRKTRCVPRREYLLEWLQTAHDVRKLRK